MTADLPDLPNFQETEFERRRGISRLEVREGFAQAQIQGLSDPIAEGRLAVLEQVGQASISVDFLKFTPSGLSFLVQDSHADALAQILTGLSCQVTISRDRHVVTVHAVNMRDEAGLVASVIRQAIQSGARFDHMTDMHDRMLIVVAAADSASLVKSLTQLQNGGEA